MKKLITIIMTSLLLPLLLCCAPEQTGLVVGPPPPATEDPEDDPVTPDTPDDPDTPAPDDPDRPGRMGKTPIIAVYFTEYTSESEFPALEDVKCFTHINAGHVRFVNKKTGDGGLEIESPGPSYMKRLAAYKASYPELKLLLFIGGWGKNADGFSMMARDPEKRKLFCSECVRLCNEYNFDGVDLDWEYPTVSADAGKNGYEGTGADPADTENFTTLVKELRAALGKNRLISYAASSSDIEEKNGKMKGKYINHKEVLQYVDYINVMTYSMGDPPYHNSPLYRSNLTRKRSGEECIEAYHSAGVPYDRMNYGIGFYGHGDSNVYPSSVQYYLAVEALEKGYYTKDGKQYDVTGKNIRCWDAQGKNCYLGDVAGTMYASYEDKESIGYRVDFLKGKGMLGAFAWEYREDAKDGTLRKELYRLMTGGQADPGQQNPPAATGGDLGASGTANSYIVSAPGSYKFKTVKGNGSASVGSVASAQLLWETAEGMVTNVAYAGNYISFSTPSTLIPGNALIAAKDASGKILWSWHIWIPKTTIGGNKYGLSFYTTMDRNLGALEVASATSGADSYGLLYQWGRKDPFQCKNATTKSGTMSIDESVANPTTFAANSGTWMSSVDKAIWGDGGTKTIYDPCPPGYKVPMREDLSGFFPMSPLSSAEGWEYAAGHAFAVGNPQVWFPYAGYLDVTGTYTGAGSSAKIWNSHMDTANNQGYGIFLSGSTSANSSQKAAQAGSVRCISIKQEEFVNEAGMPVQGSYTRKEFDSGVEELSGLCLSKDGDFLWGVGDAGYIYKFTNIDGNVGNITYTQPLDHDTFYGGQYFSESSQAYKDYWYDLEGITLDPNTGDLYIAYEPKRVMRIKSPYTTLEKKLFDVAEAADMDNGGMEGITWYKGDLYVGAQSGATLWKYSTSGTKIWKKQLGTIAPGIKEVGDLFYDSQTDLLWVVDSEAHKIFVFDGEVTKLKAVYPVTDIGNAESICVDHKRSCVWVGDDGSSSSKIYKFSFSGL